jgi:hypothetical protein
VNTLILIAQFLQYLPDLITLIRESETLLQSFHDSIAVVVNAKKQGKTAFPKVISVVHSQTQPYTVPKDVIPPQTEFSKADAILNSPEFKQIEQGD